MKKQQLVSEQQHQVVDGDIIKEISVSVYKGMTFRKARLKCGSQVVEIRAYRIEVSEAWYWDNQPYRQDHQDFGFCTSRVSGGFQLALSRIKEECSSLDDVRILMADLIDTFSAAMNGDAGRKLKQQLRYHKNRVAHALPHTQTN